MKDNLTFSEPLANLQLKHIVSQLATSFMPLTLERRSFIINHVSPDLQLKQNEALVSHTLGNLLQNLIVLSSEQCIQVYADGEGTSISVNCVDPSFCDLLNEKNIALQQQVQALGGFINMSVDKNKGTTVTFRVLKSSEAA